MKPTLNIKNSKTEQLVEKDITIKDIDMFLAFDHKAFFVENDTPKDHAPPEFTHREMEEYIKKGHIIKGLFDQSGNMMGYYIFELKPDELYISLAVDRQIRNLGVGTYILHLAQHEANNRQLKKCTLTVDSLNSRALYLYFKNGYKTTKYLKNHFGPNAHRLWMEKDLTNQQEIIPTDPVTVSCSDDDGLEKVTKEGYVGISLLRSEDNNPRNNKILFKVIK